MVLKLTVSYPPNFVVWIYNSILLSEENIYFCRNGTTRPDEPFHATINPIIKSNPSAQLPLSTLIIEGEIPRTERLTRKQENENLNLERQTQYEKTERERKQRFERLENERLQRERQQEKKRLEKERLEKERLEKERLEKERLEKERLEKERLEKERLERRKREIRKNRKREIREREIRKREMI